MHRPPDLQAFDDPDPLEEDDFSTVIEAKEFALIKYRELRAKEPKGSRVANAPNLIGTTVLHGPLPPSGGRGLAQLEPPTPTWIGRSDTGPGRSSRSPSSSSSLSSSAFGRERSSMRKGANASRPSSRPLKRVASVQMGNDETQPQDVQRPAIKKIKANASIGVSSVSKPVPVPRSKSASAAPFKRMPSRTPAQLKELEAITRAMSYADYVEYTRDNGPVRGGSSSQMLAGMVFFYATEPTSRGYATQETRGRIDLMRKNAAAVVPTFDANIVTHIITDLNASRTAKMLGYKDIQEVPLSIPTLDYKWVTDTVNKRVIKDRTVNDKFLRQRYTKNIPKRERGTSASRSSSVIMDFGEDSPGERSQGEENDALHSSPFHSKEVPRLAPAVSKDASDARTSSPPATDRTASPPKTLDGWVALAKNLKDIGADIDEDHDDHEVEQTHEGTDDEEEMSDMKLVSGDYVCRDVGQASDGPSPNEDIITQLRKLVSIYQALGGEDKWRALQTTKAINTVKRYPKRITSEEEARNLKFVGEKTAKKIMQIVRSGSMKRLKYEESMESSVVTKLFSGIYGVGPMVARDWYSRGLRTLDDVKAKKGGIRLSPAQQLGLKYYNDLQERMTREEAKGIFDGIRAIAHEIDKSLILDIMGSYRRGQETCGDIDILFTRADEDGKTHAGILRKPLPKLHEQGILIGDLSYPHDPDDLEVKYMGLCRLGPENKVRRIDILTIPYHQWGAALIYFTGDDIFNRSLRLLARHQGYSLNQRGLFSGVHRDPKTQVKDFQGQNIASRTEREIFDILKVPWQEPHERRRAT